MFDIKVSPDVIFFITLIEQSMDIRKNFCDHFKCAKSTIKTPLIGEKFQMVRLIPSILRFSISLVFRWRVPSLH